MDNVLERLIASVVCATLFCIATYKTLGAMQQSGYKNRAFWGWARKEGNMLFNRLGMLGICIALTTTVFSLCFSPFGTQIALIVSAFPFLALWGAYILSDRKYALKIATVPTGRVKRLFIVYYFLTLCITYAVIALLTFLAVWNGSTLYKLVSYAPFAFIALLLPTILSLANAVVSPFENARNARFVKRAGQKLDERKLVRVAVVGSYGKTSVKNILKTLLSEKYQTVETPASYNTPVGIAKTALSPAIETAEVFIAEMGARRVGDIQTLCELVKPDFCAFTGVCAQHIQTFGSEEAILKEKSAPIRYGARTVCGAGLQGKVEENARVSFACAVENVCLGATETIFTLLLGGQKITVKTALLGNSAVENIALGATLAYEMGLSVEEIARGVEKLAPIPHRLQLTEQNGVYILDDGYNANPRGAKESVLALARFSGKKYIVTPGLVECGVLEEKINGDLGAEIANAGLDKVILVGDTLVGAVKTGYLQAGGDAEKLHIVKTLEQAKPLFEGELGVGDCILFLNDLPDVY